MPDQILSQELFEQNEKHKLKLIELIGSGESILLAGAGVTASMFLTWKGLVDKFQAAAIAVKPKFKPYDGKETYLGFFDRVKKVLVAPTYTNIIRQTFNTENFLNHHKVLVSMPFKGFVTTNYDTVLENALSEVTRRNQLPVYIDKSMNAKVVLDFLKSLNFTKSISRKILHIHGVNYIPNSILLNQSEYMEKYGFVLSEANPALLAKLALPGITKQQIADTLSQCSLRWTTHRKILWSLLATRRVVFMGFSIEDPYFLQMLDMIKDDLNTYDDETHMAIFRLTEGGVEAGLKWKKELKEKYGIESVFFDDDNVTFPGFALFLNEIGGQIPLHKSVFQEPTLPEVPAPAEPESASATNPVVIPEWMAAQGKILSKEIRHED